MRASATPPLALRPAASGGPRRVWLVALAVGRAARVGWSGLAVLAALFAPIAPVAQADPGVRLVIDEPSADGVVRNRTDMAPLSGMAIAGERPSSFDVMLVLDTSGSTRLPSGIDIDGDGEIGEQRRALSVIEVDVDNTDPDDSILAAEIKAARSLLDSLEPGRVNVGLLTFAGAIDPDTHKSARGGVGDARLEQPLTADYELVRSQLAAVLERGPGGGTNMAAGIKLALRELAPLSGAASQPRAHAKKVVLFLTDGTPGLPFGLVNVTDPADIEATIGAARLAKSAGITINMYGLGPAAIDHPIAATESAAATAGAYTEVRRPGDIVSLLSGVSFANVEDVVAINLTLREAAGPDDILLRPDGSFSGFVPVAPGMNRVRVSALASDGTRGSTEVEFEFRHKGMTDLELRAELERVRKRSRELQLLRERKRQDEFRRQERERALELEIEDPEKPAEKR